MNTKEKKLKIGIGCLIGAAAIQTILHLVSMAEVWSLTTTLTETGYQRSLLSAHAGSGVFLAIMIVGIYFTVKELRNDKPWAWVAALVLLLFTSASWALPLSIVGLIHLLDEEVRNGYLERLSISL